MNDETRSPQEYFDQPIDASAAQEILKRNRKPQGDYTTDPERFGDLVVTTRVGDDGRFTVRFFGRMTQSKRGAEAVTNAVAFSLSPQRRPKKIWVDGQDTGQVDESKDDLQTKLYAQAIALYTEVTEHAPKKLDDLVEFLKSARYVVQTMAQGDDLMGTALKKVRVGR